MARLTRPILGVRIDPADWLAGGDVLAQLRDGRLWITLLAWVGLLAALGWSVLTLPPLPQLVVAVGVAVALFFFTRPEVALLVFFALRVPMDLLWWLPGSVGGLNMMEVFSGGVAALATALLYFELRRFSRHPAFVVFVPWVFVMGIAALRNLDVREGMEILARYLSPFVMMMLVTEFFDDDRRRRRLFSVITLLCVVPVAVSLYHLASGQMETYDIGGYNRLKGGYKNLHNHALAMMFIVTVGVFWLGRVRTVGPTLAFGALTLGAFVAHHFTFVRTSLLGLAVFAVVFLWLTRRIRALTVLTVVAVVAVATSATLQERLTDIVAFFQPDDGTGSREDLGSGRLGLWTVSMQEYLRHPMGDVVLGLGLGKHYQLTEAFFNMYAAAEEGYVDPHNDYLTLLYQMGPLSVLTYVAAQVQGVRYALKLRAITRDAWAWEFSAYVVALMAAATVCNGLSNAFVTRTTLGWYLWGLVGVIYGEYRATARRLEAERVAGVVRLGG